MTKNIYSHCVLKKISQWYCTDDGIEYRWQENCQNRFALATTCTEKATPQFYGEAQTLIHLSVLYYPNGMFTGPIYPTRHTQKEKKMEIRTPIIRWLVQKDYQINTDTLLIKILIVMCMCDCVW